MYSFVTMKLFFVSVEVTSIRSGLRKRKRAESPQSTEPQVTEEWVEEDRLELWEIKQYGDRYVLNCY
jgi:nucleosome-remodeling factor subunit BPTF